MTWNLQRPQSLTPLRVSRLLEHQSESSPASLARRWITGCSSSRVRFAKVSRENPSERFSSDAELQSELIDAIRVLARHRAAITRARCRHGYPVKTRASCEARLSGLRLHL